VNRAAVGAASLLQTATGDDTSASPGPGERKLQHDPIAMTAMRLHNQSVMHLSRQHGLGAELCACTGRLPGTSRLLLSVRGGWERQYRQTWSWEYT
jgi:hypothetical protein